MTDPSPEQVKAAARALNAAGWTCMEGADVPGQYDDCMDCQQTADAAARAALVAAAGVAPQSEARAWERGVRDAVNAIFAAHGTLTYVAPHNPWGATAALAAPGQVDEVKLAEIARSVDSHEWSRMGGSQGEQVADIVRDVMRGGGR